MREFTARQRQIIEQAMQLVARRGIQELTMRNLSRLLEVSEPALYRHFENKTDLLLALLEYIEGEVEREFREAGRRFDRSPEALRQYLSGLFTRFQAQPAMAAVVFADEAFLNEEALVRKVLALMDRMLENMAGLLEKGQQAGEIEADLDRTSLAALLIGGVRLLVRRWHIAGAGGDLVGAGRRLVETFLQAAAGRAAVGPEDEASRPGARR